MEQIAHQFAHEYEQSHPDEWRFERITAPRPSCEPLLKTRRNAPAEPKPCGFFASDVYSNIYHKNTSWCYDFKFRGQPYTKSGYATEYDAAMAHDERVLAEGIARPLLVLR